LLLLFFEFFSKNVFEMYDVENPTLNLFTLAGVM
jgi:hypothetical protein